jgi:deazaflavin-dependent oxidoreductase (nitroreductase family)
MRQYELNTWRRAANWMITRLLRLGLPIWNTYLLTVRGRKTGKPRTTPITLATIDGQRYLVAPYGAVNWVKNARAAGEVTLSRGRTRETIPVTELSPQEAAPVLKHYVEQIPIVRPFFQVRPDSPVEAFEQEVDDHPVFRLG